RLVKIRHSV
ncbi:bifunctional protein RfaE, domain I, partial [Vibrio parahaemolyticus EKP-021]